MIWTITELNQKIKISIWNERRDPWLICIKEKPVPSRASCSPWGFSKKTKKSYSPWGLRSIVSRKDQMKWPIAQNRIVAKNWDTIMYPIILFYFCFIFMGCSDQFSCILIDSHSRGSTNDSHQEFLQLPRLDLKSSQSNSELIPV